MWGGFDFDKKDAEVDYYKILGCSEGASVEQIITEYRVRALKLHPDKNPGNQVTLKEFQQLQEARDTLTDPEKKKMYDQWRKCGVGVTYQQWKHLQDRCQMTMHWASPKMTTMIEGAGHRDAYNLDWRINNKPSKGEFGDIKWGQIYGQSWEHDNQQGVYNQFRNYEI